MEMKDVHYLWGKSVQRTGQMLRRLVGGPGHRSILRIGCAGENQSAMACINADTERRVRPTTQGDVGPRGSIPLLIRITSSAECSADAFVAVHLASFLFEEKIVPQEIEVRDILDVSVITEALRTWKTGQ